MSRPVRSLAYPLLFVGGLFALVLGNPALASDPASSPTSTTPTRRARAQRKAAATTDGTAAAAATKPAEPEAISLLDALRDGKVAVDAEGTGDGRMTLSVTNRTRAPLRVVLPPGLIASSATTQFGGMGGFGGGMGGMGGGMMGGMGGGMMGGMGGGMMGGMGGMGRGGMGGGMMGGRGGMLTMPPQMGMIMLGMLIMRLVGDRDSWDYSSLRMGMMGGMGGMGMGGMGMGGMGMGGMGGMMGGGMRSVPPTGLPHATLTPGQTRRLPTRVVSLTQPGANAQVVLPQKGEKLRVGDIGQATNNAKIQAALRRLAEEKAPQAVAQLVMWQLMTGYDWSTLSRLSQGWANPQELALARNFVESLNEPTKRAPASTETAPPERGRFYVDVTADDNAEASLAQEVGKVLNGITVLGLKAETTVPRRPAGPAIACRVRLEGGKAKVSVSVPDATGATWRSMGEFALELPRDKDGQLKPIAVADALAEGVLGRVVHAKLLPAKKVKTAKHKEELVYQVRVENASPLVLNGLALAGHEIKPDTKPAAMVGVCLSPGRTMTVPAPEALVDRLGLKDGVRVLAVDLSAL